MKRELIIERTKAGLAAARGCKGGSPRKRDIHMLKIAMSAMADRKAVAHEVAKRLGITTITLYMYLNGDGTVKEPGQMIISKNNDNLIEQHADI